MLQASVSIVLVIFQTAVTHLKMGLSLFCCAVFWRLFGEVSLLKDLLVADVFDGNRAFAAYTFSCAMMISGRWKARVEGCHCRDRRL